LVISEVLASNSGALVHEGTTPDVIELFNAGGTTIDLSGMGITDNASLPHKFEFPAGTNLSSGEYLTLYADSATTSGIHLGFTLRSEGDDVSLFAAVGNGGALVDSVTFGVQLANLSIARLGPDAVWGLAQPSFGSNNLAQRTGDINQLVINEWFASGDIRFVDDFIELRNRDPLPVALGGLTLADDPAPRASMQAIPELSFIAGSGYATFLADSSPELGADHLDFNLSTRPELIYLLDSNHRQLDKIYYAPQTTDFSQGRALGAPQEYEYFSIPSPGVANPGTSTVQTVLTNFDHVWRYDNTNVDNGTVWRFGLGFWPRTFGARG
jgi:hypothetical protein